MSDDRVMAAVRVRRYLDQRRKHKGLDQEGIHGIDMGTEWGAELTVADLEAVLSLLDASAHNAAWRRHRVRLTPDDAPAPEDTTP